MKNRIVHALFVLSLLIFVACSGNPKTPTESTENHPQETTPETEDIKTSITVEKDFQQVNNISSLDIEWSEGPCSITFIGNPLLINHFEFDCDDAGLTVNQLSDPGLLQARLVITSPTLTILSNYQDATIHLNGTLKTDQLIIGNPEGGNIPTDTIFCQQFKYSSLSESTASFGHLDADEAIILADGTGKTNIDLNARHLNLQAWGTQTITLTGHADTREISISRTNMLNNQLH